MNESNQSQTNITFSRPQRLYFIRHNDHKKGEFACLTFAKIAWSIGQSSNVPIESAKDAVPNVLGTSADVSSQSTAFQYHHVEISQNVCRKMEQWTATLDLFQIVSITGLLKQFTPMCVF
jgi:hypothetical protein